MKKSEIKKQFEKVIKSAAAHYQDKALFDGMLEKYYGDVHYSDRDRDEIIDPLDYGTCSMEFETFDKIMIEINSKENEK